MVLALLFFVQATLDRHPALRENLSETEVWESADFPPQPPKEGGLLLAQYKDLKAEPLGNL